MYKPCELAMDRSLLSLPLLLSPIFLVSGIFILTCFFFVVFPKNMVSVIFVMKFVLAGIS